MTDAYKQAVSQVESICEMLAALECDYDRLEELKGEREALTEAVANAGLAADQSEMFMRDAVTTEEALRQAAPVMSDRKLLADAQKELAEWEAANREEFDELTQAAGDYSDADEAREAIQEDPLSVEVRSAWVSVGDSLTPDEFRVVLCTGGPHVELVGDLDENNEPTRMRVLYRDWGDSGEYCPSESEREALMTYLSCLHFGE